MNTLQGGTPEAAPPPLYAQGAPPLAEGMLSEEEIAAEFSAIESAADSPFFKAYIERDFYRFLAARRRLPRAGDERPAYTYKGWMLWYVWLANFYHPEVADRWGYLMEAASLGRLPDRPIPLIDFTAHWHEKQRVLGDARRLLERLGHKHGYGEKALEVLADWLAFGLGVESEFPEYLPEKTRLWLYQSVNLDDFLLHPFDYLGELLMEARGKHKKWTGFYLTPHNVCEAMSTFTRIELGEGDVRGCRMSDPACGTARQLLAFSNFSMNLWGVDIDPVCVKIAKINLALWAPSAVFPLPESFYPESPPLTAPMITAAGRLNESLSVVAPFFITGDAAPADEQAGDQEADPDAAPPAAVTAATGGEAGEPPPPARAKARAQRRRHAVSDTNQGCLFSLFDADTETPRS
jgi:hypothetical protein